MRASSTADDLPRATGFRAAVAFAMIAALAVAGVTLERPAPAPAEQPGTVAEATPGTGGIQVRAGRQALRLLMPAAQGVTYSAGAQGSMEARYVDRDTGYITVNKLDVD